MEIHFQTTDHVVAVEKVAEQHIGTKYSQCNSLRVISHTISVRNSCKKVNGCRACNLGKLEAPDKSCKFY